MYRFVLRSIRTRLKVNHASARTITSHSLSSFQQQSRPSLIGVGRSSQVRHATSSIARDFNAASLSATDPSIAADYVRRMSPLSWLKTPSKENSGLFQIKELSTPDGFPILAERVVSKCEHLLDECFSPSRRKIVEILDEISDEICRVADLAEFIRNVDVDRELKQAAEQAYGTLHHLVEKMNTNTKLYEHAKQAYERGEGDETDRRVLKLYLVDFERCGIRLNEPNRLNYLQLNDDILHLESQFRQNAHREYQVAHRDLPEKVRSR